jgi:NADPH:quinone reductase-like Zn-dependent oxidoreductase
VLVKVAAAAINPSDLSFLEGNYGYKKKVPVVPGFEGAGTVLAVGSETGLMGRYLRGKRVACVSQDRGDGVWADYVTTPVNLALPLGGDVSLEQGAMSVVNPLTAVALIAIAQKGGHKAILNTAAASALGQMIIRLGRQEGIEVVNVVRREAQVALLREQGAKFVLNSSDPDFDRQLHDLCHQQNVHLAYDAIAGRTTWQLLDALPRHSRVTIYGGLSQEPAQVLPGHVIFQDKMVDGFWLSAWLAKKNFLQTLLLWRRAQKSLGGTLKTEVRARYPLAEVREAVQAYQEQMTGGKILLVPA